MLWFDAIPLERPEFTALGLCLAASLIWAPMIYVGARILSRRSAKNCREREHIWRAALIAAILPTLAAPIAAATGFSLRPQPADDAASYAYEPIDVAWTASADRPTDVAPALPVFTVEKAVGAAAILYVYGVILMGLLWAARASVGLGTAASARPLLDDRIEAGVDAWVDRIGAARFPDIRVTPHVSSVCLTGVVRPVILVPRDLLRRVAPEDIVLMCSHELAHYARGDRRLFAATQLARVLFWFNPFIRATADALEQAAEEATDARVIRAGAARRDYAACFVEGLRFAAAKASLRPAMAIAFTPGDRDQSGRKRRLDGILHAEHDAQASRWGRASLLCAASVAGLTGLAQAGLAVDPESVAEARPIRLALPIAGDITFGFGEKGKILGPDRPSHEGVDIRAPEGAVIASPRDGVVTAVKRDDTPGVGYGKMLTVDHGDGLTTRYAHLSAIDVEPGQKVKAGDPLGAVGSTGKSKGPHLHFEALVNGEHVDPTGLIELTDAPPAPKKKSAVEPSDNVECCGDDAANANAPVGAPVTAPVRLAFNGDAAGVVALGKPLTLRSPGGAVLSAVPGGLELSAAAIDGLEDELLGDDDLADLDFDLSFDDGETKRRFRSGEPLSDEDRDVIRRAIEKMRADLRATGDSRRNDPFANFDRFRFEFNDDPRMRDFLKGKLAELSPDRRREIEAEAREAAREANEAVREALRERERAMAEAQRERDAARREIERAREEERLTWFENLAEARAAEAEALNEQREALRAARRDMKEALRDQNEDWNDALADLDDARRDIRSSDLSDKDRARAMKELERARETIAREQARTEKAIEQAMQNLEQQERDLDRLRADLKEKSRNKSDD